MRQYLYFSRITYVFLFVIFSGMFATYESDSKVYLICFLYLVISLFFLAHTNKIRIMKFPYIVSFLMLFVWTYGFVLGIVLKNPINYVIRNFAGLTLYVLIIPFSSMRFDREKIIPFVLFVAEMLLYMTCFTYMLLSYTDATFVYNIPLLNAFVGRGSKTGFVQYFGRELIHVTFAYHFYKMIYEKISFKSVFIVTLSVVNALFFNDSDGDRLAIVILMIVILVSQYKKINKRATGIVLLGIIFAITYYLFKGEGLVATLLSPSDFGNGRRYQQIDYFFHNISFWGKGLGAPLGNIGSGLYNYATEMIYLNIFHKFGVWGLLIIGCYFCTCLKAIRYMWCNRHDETRQAEKVIPIALMAYLIPSFANPMLFGTIPVTSHLIAMILLEEKAICNSRSTNGVLSYKMEQHR